MSLTVRDLLTFATKPTFLFFCWGMGEGRGGLFTFQASGPDRGKTEASARR